MPKKAELLQQSRTEHPDADNKCIGKLCSKKDKGSGGTFKCDLGFNLPEQMFQMAILLLKENNCAKLF